MSTRKVLPGGRITIPAKLREKYGLKPGTKILMQENISEIKIIRAVTKEEVYENGRKSFE